MEVTHLMIGNWVTCNHGDTQIYNLDNQHGGSINQMKPTWYRGLPLTEDWLLKFGFIQIPTAPDDEWTNGNCMIKHDAPDAKYWAYHRMGTLILADVKHIHQLQNLYFALTNEELEIVPVHNSN